MDLDIFQADLQVALILRGDNDGESVDDLLLQYQHSVLNILDTHALVVSRTRKSKKNQPWFDDVTLNLRRKQRALERNCPTPKTMNLFAELFEERVHTIIDAERARVRNDFLACRMKSLFCGAG